MTERKVLNKYFPPDFDPAKIPRLKGMKKEKVFSIRTMAPFNMMCLTCRGYIFKAKKFNSRMEESGHTYLDLKEYRFRIRCTNCCAEIVYRTDRENNDYVIESGAKRSFEAYTTAVRQAIKEAAAEKEELEKNPIKALEKRTEESMNEFKMNNKIQDLMEQSKSDAPHEEMIDNTLHIIRREFVNKQMQDREKLREEAERLIEENQTKVIEQQNMSSLLAPSTSYMNKYKLGSDASNEKSQRFKEMLLQTREKRKSQMTEEKSDTDVKKQRIAVVESNSNSLGLNYSDSDDDKSD